jgi:hypothetical protein
MKGDMKTLIKRLFVFLFWFFSICVIVGIHHTWFGIGHRGGWLSFLDGAVMVCVSFGITRTLKRLLLATPPFTDSTHSKQPTSQPLAQSTTPIP